MHGPFPHRRAAGALASSLLVAAIGCAAGEDSLDAVPEFAVVSVTEARIETLRNPLVVMGQVVPATGADFTIVAPQPAEIRTLTKGVGDPVEAGDVLVEFEIPALTQNISLREVALAQASARLDTARVEADRLAGLYDQGVVARNQYEAAQAELRSAEAALRSAEAYVNEARLQADLTRATARFAGVVTDVWHVEGDLVIPDVADPILRVIDPDRKEISIPAPLEHLGRLVEGREAAIQTAAGEGVATAVVARRLAPADPEAATAEVRLRSDAVAGLALGTGIRVEIVLDERRDVVVVPLSAVFRDTLSSFVMIAGADGRAWRRDIRIGLTTPDRAEVTEGLAPGEGVITSGAETLLDGEPITIAG
jgi:membrane fusion protein (multidrug efflux system)